jgi:hypothetical protein|tara:strand:- start:602 stop:805 length:204 start_codon:yes stop_codon:yes gene_type:complete
MMKKEYLIPLAIIISVIILSVSVYLGLTVKHRHYKAVCQSFFKGTEDKKVYKFSMQNCMTGLLKKEK